ncbi:MAG TPA: hypothetical protein VGO63_03500 [Candidatus Paceibacterota bacterium]|jgi:D-alanine-D-alanine ligase-like ATP-grasp enzyme|nr:hypothetical protein [Candidatus Paceibacterota bacterium]
MQSGTIKRIGILRGGTGNDYTSSLRHGGDIISLITENLSDKYKTFDILIDKEGVWHLNGLPVKLEDLAHRIDIAWNTLHPSFGNTLENLSIPHVSTRAFSHTLATSREMLAEHMRKAGIELPRHLVIPVYQKDFDGDRSKYSIKKAKEIHEKFGAPWIVKSFTPDSSMGIHLAKTFDELVGAIEDGVKHEKSILVEEFISGKIASFHSVPHFRGEDIYNFPLGNTYGNFSSSEKDTLHVLVRQLYTHLGAGHYMKSDFVLNSVGKTGKIYLLNIELSPDLRPDSHFSQVCDMAGVKPHHVIEHILEQTHILEL